jgi:hypothetical protein
MIQAIATGTSFTKVSIFEAIGRGVINAHALEPTVYESHMMLLYVSPAARDSQCKYRAFMKSTDARD